MKEWQAEQIFRVYFISVLMIDVAKTPYRFIRYALQEKRCRRSSQQAVALSSRRQLNTHERESHASTAGYFEGVDLYDNVNPEIVELYAGEEMVLDIGCGSGALGAKLKTINQRAIVYGIDVSQGAARRASKALDRFDLVDLDNQELPDYGVRFDIIILGDILEHLKRPDLLMLQLHRHLANNGSILVSIPNVSHYNVREMLFNGKFEYSDIGILDRTHLRFFTHKIFLELVEKCGFNIVAERHINVVPSIFGYVPRSNSRLDNFITRNFPTLVGYQFIFKLKAK